MANINPFEFKNYRVFETEIAGRKLTVETGKMAQLANGSCLVRYGDTAVLVTATASAKPRDGIDFFPLSVDFEERLYAVGRIPGSFMRREGRPSERAILASRQIARPMRPLFPKDLRNDVSIVCTVLENDYDNSPEVVGLLGASIAVSISDIPFDYVVAGCQVGIIDGKTVINPTSEQRKQSEMDVTLCATKDKIVMIEAGAKEVPEDDMFNALMEAHEELKKICAFIQGIKDEIGKPKFEYEHHDIDHDLFDKLEAECNDKFEVAMDTDDKTVRDAGVREIVDAFEATLSDEYKESTARTLLSAWTSCRRRSCAAGWQTASAWMAAAWRKSVRWRLRCMCCRACMVRACSPAARPRYRPPARWARWAMRRSWTPSSKRPKSAISTTTTSRPSRSARPARPAAPAAARSATARWRSARCCRSSRR